MAALVTPGGQPLCVYVASSRPEHEPHQVNLGDHRGNGSCNCEHFVYRLRDKAEHRAPAEIFYRCRHIVRAREWLADETIARLMKL